MRVFLQYHRGEPLNINVYQAALGFRHLGYECIPFDEGQLSTLPLSPDTPVFGNVNVVRAALRHLNAPDPPNLDLPDSVRPLLRRAIWTMQLGDVRRIPAQGVFIKPLHDHKAFPGHVVRGFADLIHTAAFSNEYLVLASEVVPFVSEYRAFVLRGEMVGLKHYRGDFCIFPNVQYVHQVIAAFPEAPVAFSVDVGVNARGETDLVEINDALALGGYGLDAVLYARLIEARWAEIAALPLRA